MGILRSDIDAAAVDGRRTLNARLIAAVLTAGLMALNLGWKVALVWAPLSLAFEACGLLATRGASEHGALSRRERAFYLASVCAMTLTWTFVPVAYWLKGGPAFQFIAVASLAGQLIHAQAFTYRSRAVLLLNGGIPAAALVAIPLALAGFRGVALATSVLGVANVMLYVVNSARANAASWSALSAERERAVGADRAKSAFLAMISHELRTPLNGVLGMANALHNSDLDEAQARCVRSISECGDHLLALLNDVLDLSKIEAGRMTIDHRPFDLPALATDAVELWAPHAAVRGVELKLELAEGPEWVLGDAMRVKQILGNLISNALKFTSVGEVRIRIRRGAASEPSGVLLEVQDTGIGISEEQQSRLFEDYVQAETSTSARFGGTGLGLSICRRLCGLLGGRIAVESRLGSGSTFIVSLPLPDVETPAREAEEAAAEDLSGWRILAVDDHGVNRAVASAVLSGAGASVETASDGVEALDRLRWGAFDAVLTDLHMPGMDGWEMSRRIRKGEAGPADLCIVALTGDALSDLGDFDAVQPKPLQPAALVRTLLMLRSRSQATAEAVRLSA